jgi:hypothetical protein
MRLLLIAAIGVLVSAMSSAALADGAYHNFKAAIYVPIGAVRQLQDPRVREQQYQRIAQQLRFDKVYLETYRGGQFADDASLEALKQFFASKGIEVAGGIALDAPGHAGQFATLDYELPRDRDFCRRAVELAARHFDQVILDDFFFYTSKSDADIAAKGKRSWTQYRLDKMRAVAQDLVLAPARAVNPRVRMIIKYPNWYEHFQGLGYDLDIEAKKFDFIYTGTETRDPEITDQLLQQYESYLVFRYMDNIRPDGGNRGGWVDTYDTRYVDRYAEQLWDTLFAKAPEITLFNWADLSSPAALPAGDRQAWSGQQTSFDWDAMVHSAQGAEQSAAPGWARAAGWSLAQADRFLGQLGKPIGIASYKPYQSSGEDFLQAYLGNIGIPIELMPEFPTQAKLVLLTQSAAQDPQIIAKIKRQLVAGGAVAITSGLVHALQDRGLKDIVELEYTGRRIAVHDFVEGYGAGAGTSGNDPGSAGRSILYPELRFYTNDSWPLIRGVTNAHGVPIMLLNRYSRGVLYVLNIPDNPGDLYQLPQPVTNAIRGYLQADFPVRIDAPAQVSLFAYDNGSFIVQSYRSESSAVDVSIAGAHAAVHDLLSGELLTAAPETDATSHAVAGAVARSSFHIQLPPHSYRVFDAH